MFSGSIEQTLPKKFITFDQAFSYAKDRFENHLEDTLKTDLGIELVANLFCISQISFRLLPADFAEEYKIDIGVFDQHPQDVEEYPCENADKLHVRFLYLKTNVLQRDTPPIRNQLQQIQTSYLRRANEYLETKSCEVNKIKMRF